MRFPRISRIKAPWKTFDDRKTENPASGRDHDGGRRWDRCSVGRGRSRDQLPRQHVRLGHDGRRPDLLAEIDFDNIHYYIKPKGDQARDWNDVPEDIKKGEVFAETSPLLDAPEGGKVIAQLPKGTQLEKTAEHGKHTLVESSRQFLGEKVRNPVQYIDIWKLSLDGNERWERITHFTDYEGYKSSNPVVSDDGRYIAFQMARRGDPAGVGRGLFLLDLDAMQAAAAAAAGGSARMLSRGVPVSSASSPGCSTKVPSWSM